MTILDDIRAQHPGAYDDMSDGQLASAFRKKYYADMPAPDFYRKAGLADLVGLTDKPVTGVSDSSVDNFRAGMGKAFSDTVSGLNQLGNRVANLQSFGLDPSIQASYDQMKADQSDASARDKALLQTKAGLGGNIAGYASQILAPAGALGLAGRGAAVGGALLPSTLSGAAKQGAVMGLAQPLEAGQGEGTRLLNTGEGAAMGVVGASVPRAIGAGLRGAKGLLAPFFESGQNGIVADALGRFGGDAALNARPSAVPGVQATLAEQTGDAGLAQLQRAVMDSDPAIARQFADARNANNGARLGLLQGIAGDDSTLAAAKASRASQASQLYSQAVTDAAIQPSADLVKLAQRPSMQKAIDMAKGLAAENDQDIGDALSSTQGLHYVKLALDNLANVAGKPGFENVTKSSVRGTQNDLINEIGKIAPDYLTAKDAYKAASGPINQQQILQGLLGKATTNTEDAIGNQVMQPTRFANNAANLDALAQKATGQKGISAASILTPAQQDTIGLLGSDLSRQAVADSAGKSAGSNTVQNLASQSLLGNVTRGAGLPGLADSGLLGRVVKPVDAAYRLFGIPDQLKEKLAQVMLNPNTPESQAILAKIPKNLRPTIESQLGPIFGTVGQSARLGISQ